MGIGVDARPGLFTHFFRAMWFATRIDTRPVYYSFEKRGGSVILELSGKTNQYRFEMPINIESTKIV